MRPRRALVPLVLGLLTPLLLPGCSSDDEPDPGPSQPPVSAFREGTGRAIAPAVLQVGRDVRLLGEGPTPPQDVLERLTTAQTSLVQIQGAPGLDPVLVGPVEDLVTRIGFVRLRGVSNTYGPELATQLGETYDLTLATCTAPPAATPPD